MLSVRNAEIKLKDLENLFDYTSETAERKSEIRAELNTVHSSLDKILDLVNGAK
jgi:hypothetical protein